MADSVDLSPGQPWLAYRVWFVRPPASWCQQCMPVDDKTGISHAVL